MSELQLSLLGIGVLIVLAIYLFSLWQQRQYRKRFSTMFDPARPTAKVEPKAPVERVEPRLEPEVDPEVEMEAALVELEAEVHHAVEVDAVPDSPVEEAAEPVRLNATDEMCRLLDAEFDYIAELSSDAPMSAGTLEPLWQQRFDFGKNVNACGLNAAGYFEKVIPESSLSYHTLRIALQLVDRSGAVSESRLGDFRKLIAEIAEEAGAQAEFPDVAEMAQRAKALDSVCGEVDQIIGLNLIPRGERMLPGAKVQQVAHMQRFALQADGAFHFVGQDGHTLFVLQDIDNTPFQHHTLPQVEVKGLTMLMEVPRVASPAQQFDLMAAQAKSIAEQLRAVVVDDRREVMGDTGIQMIHKQIAEIEQAMLLHRLEPGSAQARRLFS